jgi:hypothetical protein
MKHILPALCLAASMLSTMAQAPAPAEKPVIDHVTVPVSDTVAFTIPITDPRWEKYKGYLPSLTLNSTIWDGLATTLSRTDLEMRLHDEIAASYLKAVAQARTQNAPIVKELTQAAYVAQQPGATEAQKNAYAAINAKDAPALNQSTRPLMAVRLLLLAMQDDIHMAPGYSGLYSGKIVAKPGAKPDNAP